LKETVLDVDGAYTVDIGTYTGPIVVKVTGTYKDEATGLKVTIKPEDPPLRAIISDAKVNVQVNVTPLTELAARQMGSKLTPTIIASRNANIAALFNVANIINTKPVDATTIASKTALPEEKKQSLVLAAISQLMANDRNTDPTKTLAQVLADMTADITIDATNPANVTMKQGSTLGFKTAMLDFVTVNPLNQSGVISMDNAPILSTPPGVIAAKVAHMKISTAGLAPGAIIGGIDFTFTLPAGVTLGGIPSVNDPTIFQVTPGTVVASVGTNTAAASGTSSITLATFSGQSLRTVLANAQGFAAGKEFINISCTVPAGNPTTAANFITAITSATVTATDLKGAPIPGIITLTAALADVVVF
jgi:hypothetical protein